MAAIAAIFALIFVFFEYVAVSSGQGELKRTNLLLVIVMTLLAVAHPLAEGAPHSPVILLDGLLVLVNLGLVPYAALRNFRSFGRTSSGEAVRSIAVLVLHWTALVVVLLA
jgi:hypothetical protein